MQFFAGPIFTEEELMLMVAVAILIYAVVVGVVTLVVWLLLYRYVPRFAKKIGKPRFRWIAIIMVTITIGTILVFVLPTHISDRLRESRRENCAQESGYNPDLGVSYYGGEMGDKQETYYQCMDR